MAEREFIFEFRSGVNALVKNELIKIKTLTQVAGEQRRYAKEIMDIIVQRIRQVLNLTIIPHINKHMIHMKLFFYPKQQLHKNFFFHLSFHSFSCHIHKRHLITF